MLRTTVTQWDFFCWLCTYRVSLAFSFATDGRANFRKNADHLRERQQERGRSRRRVFLLLPGNSVFFFVCVFLEYSRFRFYFWYKL